jgi:hypothetical protein
MGDNMVFQNKLLLRFDPVEIRKATLQRSKTQGSKRKGSSPKKEKTRKCSSPGKASKKPSMESHTGDDDENLADMVDRVNSKLEKLFDDINAFSPMPSEEVASKNEAAKSAVEASLPNELTRGLNSDEEPDPEDSSSPKAERNQFFAPHGVSYEQLVSEVNALVRENRNLKMELAAAKACKMTSEMGIQTTDNKVGHVVTDRHAERSSLKKNVSLRKSASVKELRSASAAPKADVVFSPPSLSATPRAPATARFRERSQSVDVGVLLLDSIDAASASSVAPNPPLTSRTLSRMTSAPSANVFHPAAFDEYVQYHKEPMVGGWREFYVPKSMVHNVVTAVSPSASRSGSKSCSADWRYQGHQRSGSSY